MPRVAQKLQPISTLAGKVNNRIRLVEAAVVNGDFAQAEEDLFLAERAMRQIRKHVNGDTDDSEDTTPAKGTKVKA